MPLCFDSITNSDDANLKDIRHLYETTFPLHERRLWKDMLALIDKCEMNIFNITDNHMFIGFIISWAFEEFTFLEHFAIAHKHRNKGFGREILKWLKQSAIQVILETEPPIHELACRRLAFYEREGFQVILCNYQQPPYRAGSPAVPMKLLGCKPINEPMAIQKVIDTIRINVYEKWSASQFD